MNKKIYDYVMDCITDADGNEIKSPKRALSLVFKTLREEKYDTISRYGYRTAFGDWAFGLPSIFHIDFEDYKIRELLNEWGYKVDDRYFDMFKGVVWVAISELCELYGVDMDTCDPDMEYLYVLDYNAGGVYRIDVLKTEDHPDMDDLLSRYGLNADECSWMWSEKVMDIEVLEEEEPCE